MFSEYAQSRRHLPILRSLPALQRVPLRQGSNCTSAVGGAQASRFDAGTAYLSVDGHQVNNRDPWIYKTTDYGKTWKLMVNGIPKSPLSYVHVVREDPVRRGLLYAGTENGMYASFSDGET
jgi:hypothetical protein